MTSVSRPSTPSFGFFLPVVAAPKKNGLPIDGTSPPPEGEDLLDPRHRSDSPWPWLRYFMPKDFEVREGDPVNVFYQYFDVRPTELQEDLSVPPPDWCPGAFFRLSFTEMRIVPGQSLRPGTASLSPHDALDAIRGNTAILAEGAETLLEDLKKFCRSVASFQARTWRDAFPLVDLLRGVILYLLGQMEAGQALALEYARRDMALLVEMEKAKMAAEAELKLDELRVEIQAEADRRIASAGDETRRKLQEETLAALRAEKEESARLAARHAQAETTIKKLNEQLHGAQRSLEKVTQETDSERRESKRSLGEKEKELVDAKAAVASTQDGLLRARQAVLDALRARTKQEVMAVAVAAISAALPGAHAFVSELRAVPTAGDGAVEAAEAAHSEMQELKKHPKYTAGLLDASLAPFTPGFLSSPLGAGMLRLGAQAGIRGSTTGGRESTSGAAGGARASEAGEDGTPVLMLKYVHASADQAFMVGQNLAAGQGVSWDAVANGKEVYVPDVSANRAVKHFRASTPGAGGAFLALPLMGRDGEVVGMLSADNLTGTDAEKEFVRQLAATVQQAIVRDQEALARLRNLAAEDDIEPPPLAGFDAIDPEPHADMEGGVVELKTAVAELKGVTTDMIEDFKAQEKPDETTMAVLKGILGLMGSPDGNGWDTMRGQVNADLLKKLTTMSPEDAWAEWGKLCQSLAPAVLMAKAGVDLPTAPNTKLGAVLGRWVNAVRKIAAARAMRKLLEQKLARANKKLMATFSSGDGGSALVELRSYRIPPKLTMIILQSVFTLMGASDDDRVNWGKMRVQTNYKMIKQLTAVKTRDVPPAAMQGVLNQLKDMKEEDVKQESLAALALWRWLAQFMALAQMEMQHLALMKVL